MARRGENIYKRKDGRWEGRYKNGFKTDGKTRYSSVYGASYSEVKTFLTAKHAEQKTSYLKCNFSFGELSDLWIESILHNFKESTYSNYSMKLEKHIIPYKKYNFMLTVILNPNRTFAKDTSSKTDLKHIHVYLQKIILCFIILNV